MAVEYYLKKVEALLTPGPGEPPTGFITAADLQNAFSIVLLAIDETYVLREEQEVVKTLLHPSGKIQDPAYLVVDDLRNLLYKWSAAIETSSDAGTAKAQSGLLGTVYGDAVPTTIAKTVEVLNSLIAALGAIGLVRDGRSGVVAPIPPAAVPPTDLVAPVSPSKSWTFLPKEATLPVDLPTLIGAPDVGDVDLAVANQTAFAVDESIVLADGSRATWDGSAWSTWLVAITGLSSPRPGTNEWTFLPAHAVPPFGFAALQAHPVVGDTALNLLIGTPDEVSFVTDEFIKLRDNTSAYFTATHSLTSLPSSWQPGVAP